MQLPNLKTKHGLGDKTDILWQPNYGIHNEYLNGVANTTNLPTATSTALFGQAANFDNSTSGSESRVEIAGSTGFRFGSGGTGNFVVYIRAYYPATAPSDYRVLFAKGQTSGSGVIVGYIKAGGAPEWAIGDGVSANKMVLSGTSYAGEGWHNLLFFRNGDTFGIIEDDVIVDYETLTGGDVGWAVPTYSDPLYIGYYPPTPAYSWDGPIQDVMIRNTIADYTNYVDDLTRIRRG